ncbi:MAG TPA: hypothetical protein VLH79_04350 [Chthonomonadales bacterium]|nr:hypothetical protein [Chthonomonadales bacterium]
MRAAGRRLFPGRSAEPRRASLDLRVPRACESRWVLLWRDEGDPPSGASLLYHAAAAVEAMPPGAGRAWLGRYLDAKLLRVRIDRRRPAIEVALRASLWPCRLEEAGSRRAASATRVAWLRAVDAPGMPPFGALLGAACARRAAQELDALVVDVTARRALTPGETALVEPEAFALGDVVSVRLRADRDRRIAAHTAGLSRLGLPELEVRGASAAVREAARRLLLSVGQRLHALLAEQAGEERGVPRTLRVELPLAVHSDDLARGASRSSVPESAPLAAGLARLPSWPARPRLLVTPPPGSGLAVSAWLYGAALEFLCPEGVPGVVGSLRR